MDKAIQKPLSIVRSEFINTITSVVNNSGLPPFIIEPILKDMYEQCVSLSAKQLKMETEEYNRAVAEQFRSEQETISDRGGGSD